MSKKNYQFTATIQAAKQGGAFVVFPYDIRQEFGKGRVKVQASFDGEPYIGSIVNMGFKDENGNVCYILGILKAIREKIAKQVGDSVIVTVQELV